MSAATSTHTASALHRVCASLSGPLFAAIITGFVFGHTARAGERLALGWRLASLLVAPALFLGLTLAFVSVFFTPSLRDRLRARVLAHGRTLSSLALVVPAACVIWAGLTASAGKFFMTAFHHVGLASLAQATALLFLTLVTVTAAALAVSTLSRRRPEPGSLRGAIILPLSVGFLIAALLFAHGLYWGTDQGHSPRIAMGLGGFGVLKKSELDLTPVFQLMAISVGGTCLALVLSRFARTALLVSLTASIALVAASALHFGDSETAATIDARPSVSRAVLRTLRKLTDRDHDGFAKYFGGGDCNDRDRRVNPDAVDLAGNNLDEDCSGRDARSHTAPVDAPPSQNAQHPAVPSQRFDNLVIITVDTLRWDTHFAGNPNPITPNIDRLAARSVVFDNAYALSSYTGRAIGPLLTGRYPTECPRDSEHFTRYTAGNVFLAERLKSIGFRTFGAASHFYFEPRFGLTQGLDVWDLSATPHGGEQETSSADHRVADRAIALLQDPTNTRGRFFLWVHFFDPHKQYVDHPELPLFGRGERARYDREVMWSDRQVGRVLDALDALPDGVSSRTAVMLTADHGEAFNEHGMSWHGVELWQELVRVPWIVHLPGVSPRRVTTPRSQIDLVPTVCDLLGVAPPARDAPDAFSGESLRPELYGASMPERAVYIELPEGPYNSLRRAVIDHGFKLTERGARRFELYDLRVDPAERTNLAVTSPDELARMREVLETLRSGLHPVTALPRREH